jgi:hypothetical protein
MENDTKSPQKINSELTYDPVIPLIGIYPKVGKSRFYKSTRMPIFISALFTIGKQWKQPICPRTD